MATRWASPLDAIRQARQQHAMLYLDTVQVLRRVVVDKGRYQPSAEEFVPYGEPVPALVQVEAGRAASASVAGGPASREAQGIVVKMPLTVEAEPGWRVRVLVSQLTPEIQGREYTIGVDGLQSLAVCKLLRATWSRDAGLRA